MPKLPLILLLVLFVHLTKAQENKLVTDSTDQKVKTSKVVKVLEDSLKKYQSANPLPEYKTFSGIKDSTSLDSTLHNQIQVKTGNAKVAVKEATLDSLRDAGLLTPEMESYYQKLGIKKDTVWLDSLGNKLVSGGKEIGKQELLKEVPPEGAQYLQEAERLKARKDSLNVVKELENQAEQQSGKVKELAELQKQTGEADKLKGMPDEYKKQGDAFQDKDQMKKKLMSESKNLANDHLANYSKEVEEAQKQLAKAKKKYVAIKDGENLEPRNSMKGRPLGKRLYYGGNFQFVEKEPFSLDVSPFAGYQWTKKFSTGIGASYRCTIGRNKLTLLNQEETYGYRVFTEYILVKSFFAHIEFESVSRKIPSVNENPPQREWVNGALAGFGKLFQIHKKLKGQVSLLYNVMHDPLTSPYNSPWVVRVGLKR